MKGIIILSFKKLRPIFLYEFLTFLYLIKHSLIDRKGLNQFPEHYLYVWLLTKLENLVIKFLIILNKFLEYFYAFLMIMSLLVPELNHNRRSFINSWHGVDRKVFLLLKANIFIHFYIKHGEIIFYLKLNCNHFSQSKYCRVSLQRYFTLIWKVFYEYLNMRLICQRNLFVHSTLDQTEEQLDIY